MNTDINTDINIKKIEMRSDFSLNTTHCQMFSIYCRMIMKSVFLVQYKHMLRHTINSNAYYFDMCGVSRGIGICNPWSLLLPLSEDLYYTITVLIQWSVLPPV